MLNISVDSIANTMVDNAFTDAERLRNLISRLTVTQAEFARSARVPGGPSMLSQNMSGHRPISLDAGIAYARGLGVPIGEISPRLAEMLADAVALLARQPSSASARPSAPALREALPVVLGRMAGLDAYTAGKVLAALQAATQPHAPLAQIEKDLAQWLSAMPAGGGALPNQLSSPLNLAASGDPGLEGDEPGQEPLTGRVRRGATARRARR